MVGASQGNGSLEGVPAFRGMDQVIANLPRPEGDWTSPRQYHPRKERAAIGIAYARVGLHNARRIEYGARGFGPRRSPSRYSGQQRPTRGWGKISR
jgi:hypothetical protein